ncbi:MAG: PRC-barrel domain-containing protein [Cytophagaceae bacterium]
MKIDLGVEKVLTTSAIIGDEVVNHDGEHLGEIKELLIDPKTGKVEFGILSFGGFLGIGNKYFAVPYENFSKAEGCYLLDVKRQVLENALLQIEYKGRTFYVY